MEARQTTIQTPRPEVKIYDPMADKPKLEFDTSKRKVLQAYSFKTSVDDPKGQFTLTFYPDEEDWPPFFDRINMLDIVEIYESKNHYKQYYMAGGVENPCNVGLPSAGVKEQYIQLGSGEHRTNYKVTTEILPTFIGVIRSKKYAAGISGTSVKRSITISGHSIAGLVDEFYLNMDSTAMAVTKRYRAQEHIKMQFVEALAWENADPRPISEIIEIIWNSFVEIAKEGTLAESVESESEENEKEKLDKSLSNIGIYEILKKWVGDKAEQIFDIDNRIDLKFPLGCIYDGRQTKSFFSFIEGLIPQIVYERFAYMERGTGKMRIKIRECPFEMEDWEKLRKHEMYEIPTKLVKSVNIEQSDNEVYTAFFSYIDNSPIGDQQYALKLAAMEERGNPTLTVAKNKYSYYGYRPLLVNFRGYGRPKDGDDKTVENITNLNKKLMRWYGKLDEMYNGQLILSTELSKDMPQAGEVISILGGEFYVTSAEHRWNYKGNPETVLQISRGGDYEMGEFEELLHYVEEMRFLPNKPLDDSVRPYISR